MEFPPVRVIGIAGIGPDCSVNPPAASNAEAVTLLAVAPPVLVTVRVTSVFWPVHIVVVRATRRASSAAGTCAVPATGLNEGPVVTTTPELPSLPVTVVVKVRGPAEEAVIVKVNTTQLPPVMVSGPTGKGPASTVAAPPPEIRGTGTVTPVALAPPVFVTVTVTRKVWPFETVPGIMDTDEIRFAASWMV